MKRNRQSSKLATFLSILFVICSFPCLVWGEDTAAPEKSNETGAVQAEGEKPGYVTMDFKEADINTVLRLLSLKSETNIVAGPEVKGTVTVRLENVPWQEALEVVLRTYGYVYEKKGNIIRVTTRENLAQEDLVTDTFILEYIQLGRKTEKETEGKTSQEDAGKELLDIITTMLSERGRVKMVTQRNAIVVTDTATNVYKISEVIKKLDQRTSQAYIDSKIVKTQLDKGENLGIKWGAADLGVSSGASRPVTFPFASQKDTEKEYFPGFAESFLARTSTSATTTGSTTTGTVSPNTNEPRFFPFADPTVANRTYTFGALDFTKFSALLSMLQSRSNTKVISNPRIVVLNNQTAKVKVGSEIPIPSFDFNQQTASFQVSNFKYRDVGVVLSVTPHINSAEEILVDLRPEVSALGSTITFTSTLAAPSFDVTSAQTQVLIRSGETIAIGGLMQDNVAVSEQEVPYLSSLPIVGKAFRSKRQTEGSGNRKVETLFFVTVTLVDTEGQPAGVKRAVVKAPFHSKDTVGAQSMVKTPESSLSPAKAGTG